MNEKPTIQPGRYRHYKGQEYTVIGTARHSETLEALVVYRQEYGKYGLWVRPEKMFAETVTVDGQQVPRFQSLATGGEHVGERNTNLFADLPFSMPQEVVQTLVQAANVRIERIVSHGHASTTDFWYEQPQHEWVILLQGAARLQFEDGMVELKPGDFINIAAHQRHRVDWTTPAEPTIWLAVHYAEASQPKQA